jgi:ribosomal protein S17E
MGESKEDFVKRLAEMLLEERYFKKFLPLLRSLGYKPKA